MTKKEITPLIEADELLQWWAAVLFAEICELIQYIKDNRNDKKEIEVCYPLIAAKSSEFERMVIGRSISKAEQEIKQRNIWNDLKG